MYAASWVMPRKGLAGARTSTPAACTVGIAPAQFEASAKAPCTSTTVRGAASAAGVASVMVFPSWVVMMDGRTRDGAPYAVPWDIPRPAAATTAAPAPASRPTVERRDSRPSGMAADTVRVIGFLLSAKRCRHGRSPEGLLRSCARLARSTSGELLDLGNRFGDGSLRKTPQVPGDASQPRSWRTAKTAAAVRESTL